MRRNLWGVGLTLVFAFATVTARAADRYVLPHGAGSHDGSSWANAMDASSGGLQKGWDTLQPGESCFVGGGEYAGVTLSLGSGGTPGRVKKLVGMDRGGMRPRFVGTWNKETPAKGPDCITLKQGASYWSIENLDLRRYRNAVISSGGQHTGVRLINVDVTGARSGMELVGGGLAAKPEIGTHDVLIQDCEFVHFTKRGIRFQGGNYNVRVVNCLADAGGAPWATELFHMGFSIQGSQTANKKPTEASPDHDITFAGCTAKNSYNDAGTGYWNADGFCAESTPYNLRYENCVALDCTDGGWDDKSRNPVLVNCVALRNKRNFRFWTTKGQATLTNCIAAYALKRGGNGTAAGLWTHGTVLTENCTFHDNPIGIDLSTAEAKMTLRNGVLSLDPGTKGVLSTVDKGAKLTLTDTSTWGPNGIGDDPQYVAARPDWNGIGNALNNRRYGSAKGYQSTRH